MNPALIPVNSGGTYSFGRAYINTVGAVFHFVKHKYYRGEGHSRSNLFFRLPTVISYKLMARVVTAQTPSSIYKLTNETPSARARVSSYSNYKQLSSSLHAQHVLFLVYPVTISFNFTFQIKIKTGEHVALSTCGRVARPVRVKRKS